MTERDIREIFKRDIAPRYQAVWYAPSFKKMRWDIFGAFDCLAINKVTGKPDLIQFTDITNMAHRRTKIKDTLSSLGLWGLVNAYLYGYDKNKSSWRAEKIIPHYDPIEF